jgi:hypothetical protein
LAYSRTACMAVVLGQWDGRPVTVSVKRNCLTVSIERRNGEPDVFSYDYAGRLWTAQLDEKTYRRGLDGKLVAKWVLPDRTRERRWLYPEEARTQVETRPRQQMVALYEAIRGGAVGLSGPLTEQGTMGFERAIAFAETRSAADVEHYHRVYKPVGSCRRTSISRWCCKRQRAVPSTPARFVLSTGIARSASSRRTSSAPMPKPCAIFWGTG